MIGVCAEVSHRDHDHGPAHNYNELELQVKSIRSNFFA